MTEPDAATVIETNQPERDEAMRLMGHQIGRMVLIAGRIEGQLFDLARGLNIDVGKLLLPQVMKGIRRVMSWYGLPPWATATPIAIERHLQDVTSILNERHAIIHSSWYYRATVEGEWIWCYQPTRAGQPELVLTLDGMKDLNVRLQALEYRAYDVIVNGVFMRALGDDGVTTYATIPPRLPMTPEQDFFRAQFAVSTGAANHYVAQPIDLGELLSLPAAHGAAGS